MTKAKATTADQPAATGHAKTWQPHILVFADDVGKDRIGLPWTTVPSNAAEIRRLGALLS